MITLICKLNIVVSCLGSIPFIQNEYIKATLNKELQYVYDINIKQINCETKKEEIYQLYTDKINCSKDL